MEQKELEQMLAAMARAGATSLHLIPGHRPCIRVQRKFIQSEHDAITAADIDEVTRDLLFDDHRERLQREGQVEVLYVAGSGQRFRTTVMRQEAGTALLFRPVPEAPPQLRDLELPGQIGAFVQYRSGLVLVTGFFGSGKSTTLAALVDRFNHDTARHVVTIEETIEYLHPQGQALLHQREIGPHVLDYPSGIRQSMRLGAEVIVLTELRDAAALHAVLDAVESGCLVIAGFDASSVVGALVDVIALAPPEERARVITRLAMALRAVTAQTLLPCAHKQGRVPMVEILINNAAVRAIIRQGNFEDLAAVMTRCRGLGMQTADLALRGMLAHHLITPEEALQHATHPDGALLRSSHAPAGVPRAR